MSFSKADQFTEEQQQLALIGKALSHPGRIAILEFLATRSMCVCGEIVDQLPLSQATVSQHLKVLREAGLITGEIEGPKTCYCIDEKVLTQTAAMFAGWFAAEKDRITACCQSKDPDCC